MGGNCKEAAWRNRKLHKKPQECYKKEDSSQGGNAALSIQDKAPFSRTTSKASTWNQEQYWTIRKTLMQITPCHLTLLYPDLPTLRNRIVIEDPAFSTLRLKHSIICSLFTWVGCIPNADISFFFRFFFSDSTVMLKSLLILWIGLCFFCSFFYPLASWAFFCMLPVYSFSFQ